VRDQVGQHKDRFIKVSGRAGDEISDTQQAFQQKDAYDQQQKPKKGAAAFAEYVSLNSLHTDG
jgi:hypothetical protein